MRPILALTLLLLLPLSTAHANSYVSAVERSLKAGHKFVPGQLLVKYKAGTREQFKYASFRAMNALAVQPIPLLTTTGRVDNDLLLVKIPRTSHLLSTIKKLATDPAIEYSEPNWILAPQLVANPNEPALNMLWGLYGPNSVPSNVYGSGALEAWNNGVSCSNQIVVGVVDEGVMFNHGDLRAAMWSNPGEGTTWNNRDDDRNGYIDDRFGWDFFQRNGSVYDGPADDHGTHVAGTIAATANNGIGVVGVCPGAKLISGKFIGSTGTTDNAVRATNYMSLVKRTKNIKLVATNNSWGGGGYSQALQNAILTANYYNILFIAAAGNSGRNIDLYPVYPASFNLPNVITVAAIDSNGARASFSNYGENTVDIAAPGVAILSTTPTKTNGSGYSTRSGTSMAAPHVAGAAALYASLNPCATAQQIKTAILDNAVYDNRLVGYVDQGRRLDVTNFTADLNCPP